ncbi:hypothetical protein C1E24_18170 [Pseudoalteromonas phenolica]|uniref:Uncharacterized protein n=1 Tax=Pseudoalteromonas phenolica TaxID=161398 RepID=A0A5R9Q052_9GAMM|nr:hypothetical protein C1E24_18170 [Pseudoalteromonas phenolica]
MLKIPYLEQLNSKIFASLPTSFSCLKIDRLIKRIGIIVTLSRFYVVLSCLFLICDKIIKLFALLLL